MMLNLLLTTCCVIFVTLHPTAAAFLDDLQPRDIAVINVVSPGFGPPDKLRFHVEPEYPADTRLDSMAYNAIFTTYSYCKHHSYSYLLIYDYEQLHPRCGLWYKVKQLQHVMNSNRFKVIIMADVDVVFHQRDLRLEELMRKWNVFSQEEQVVAMASEPHYNTTECIHGQPGIEFCLTLNNGSMMRMVNTGLQIWRVSERAKDLVAMWWNSVDRPKGSDFLDRLPAQGEQGAFTYFVRGEDMHPEELVIIPCDEANGFPPDLFTNAGRPRGNYGCSGKFVAHLWENTKLDLARWSSRVLLQEYKVQLHRQLQLHGHYRHSYNGTLF